MSHIDDSNRKASFFRNRYLNLFIKKKKVFKKFFYIENFQMNFKF